MSVRSSLRVSVLGWMVLAAVSFWSPSHAASSDHRLTAAAATSLRKVFPVLAEAFRKKDGGADIQASYGASGDLRKQIERGAPADLVLFASADPVDALKKSGHVLSDTSRVVARNRLVLIGPKGSPKLTFQTLPKLPKGERFAMGEPGAVPAGAYASKALVTLGIWDALKDRVVYGADVGQVLAYVKRGEVGAGIVYQTELHGVEGVELWDVASGTWAPQPVVVGAIVKHATESTRALAFLEFITSQDAAILWTTYGFGLP
jgi:molybdate transport system substrate-binding protein